MPLFPNKYQPYFPDPDSPNPIDCLGEYCYPVFPGDEIYWQGYQTPCGQNIITDPIFTEFTLGADLVTNGAFVCPYTPWVGSGGFSCNSDSALYTGNIGGGDIYQGIAMSIGNIVEVTFTVSGSWNGGFMSVLLGTTEIASITDPGTYTVSGVYGAGSAELKFDIPVGSPIASITLDDVSAKVLSMDDWGGNAEWIFSDGFACKQIAGTGVLIETVANYITSGTRYRLTFTISGNTAGTLTPKVGTTSFGAISGNGIKTVWVDSSSVGVLSFEPSSTWDGCISELDLREMKLASDFGFDIISELGDGDVTDISSYVELYEDWVTLIYDPQDNNLPEECYILRIYDTCSVQYEDMVTNGAFIGGTTTSVPSWFRNNTGNQYDFSGGEAEFIFEPLTGETNLLTNGDFSSGLASWTAGAGWSASGGALHTPGSTATIYQDVAIVGTSGPTLRTQWVQFTISGRTAGSVAVGVGNSATTSFSINDVITVLVAPTVFGSIPLTFTPTSDFDGTIEDVQVIEQVNEIWIKFPGLRNIPNPLFVPGNYEAQFEITSNTDTTNIAIGVTINGLLVTTTYLSTVGSHTVALPGYTGAATEVAIIAKFIDLTTGNSYPGRIAIDNVEVYRTAPFDATYTSECIQYGFSDQNTQLVRAYCDSNNLGFEFENSGFYLQQRIVCRSMSPQYPGTTNIAKFGSGDARLTYSDQEKYWIFATDWIDESAHDALSIQLKKCNHLQIGIDVANFKEYISDGDEYTVPWRGEGDYNLMETQVRLRIKSGGQIFNRLLE